MLINILLAYLGVGLAFIGVAFLSGIWESLTKEEALSEVSNYKILLFVCVFHLLAWPLIVVRVCAKLWQTITGVSRS